LRAMFAPPTSSPAQRDTFDPQSFKRYSPPMTSATRAYALIQYALLIAPTTHFIAVSPTLTLGEQVAYALLILVWTVGVGWVLEGRRYARVFEWLRVGGTTAALLLMPSWFGWSADASVELMIAAIALGSLRLIHSR